MLKQAIVIDKKVLGEDHSEYATDLHNLAILYKKQGFYNKAEPLYLEALDIVERAFGELHPNVAVILENIAILYVEWDKKEKAIEYYLRAEEIKKKLAERDGKK